MNLTKLLIGNAFFAAIGGIGLLFMPVQLMSPYGVTLDAAGVFLAQLLGIVLLGYAALNWYARNVKDKVILKAVVISALVSHIGSAGVSLVYLNSGILNSYLWIDIVLHGLFAAGFWYWGFSKK